MPKPRSKLLHLYGCDWQTDDVVQIERECIRLGGTWQTPDGVTHGMGLAHHVEQFARYVWPWFAWHRWAKMLLNELCKPSHRLGVFGPSSAGKSSPVALTYLTFYLARPTQTTVLVSSTTRDELELRIWGEMVMFWREAKEQFDWVPGYLLDSKQMILTDGKDSEFGRDRRSSIQGRPCKIGNKWLIGSSASPFVGIKNDYVYFAGDECFPAGTLIDTPLGVAPIESIHVGHWVQAADGFRQVAKTFKRKAEHLLRVTLADGRIIRCTPNHRFFTQFGWRKAVELNQTCYILSGNESLQILRKGNSRLPTREQEAQANNLQSLLRSEIDAFHAGSDGEKKCQTISGILSTASGASRMGTESFGTMAGFESSNANTGAACQDFSGVETHWTQAKDTRWQWHGTDTGREDPTGCVPVSHKQLSDSDEDESWEWLSDVLQNRYRLSRDSSRYRGGWRFASCSHSAVSGFEENPVPRGSWVDCVEVEKSTYSGRDGCGSDRIEVYNLQVAGHPSYCVNGLLVHNCGLMPPGFIDAFANLASNEHFSAACLGNLGDLDTPLGTICEPKQGWDSLPDSDIARVYDTRWSNGRAVQFIGTDSPNLDYPEGAEPYPKIIGRRYLKQLEADYGKDTPLYNMFAAGKIPRGTMENRVITKDVCLRNQAFDEITWGHEPITKLYAMDISYLADHGDRTVGRPLAFGKDNEGMLRLALIEPPLVYTPNDRASGSIEEQLAAQCMAECKRLGIPASHVFFDGTGRSSFTAALMRLWSTEVVPIEFGGQATARPNFVGRRYHEDLDYRRKEGDLLPCNEVFGKMVTELWFAFRAVVDAKQLRGLDMETVKEAEKRLWKITAGNRIDVETKKDMKLRLGRSPDLADTICVGLEGARRLGFNLGQLQSETKRRSQWFSQLKRDFDAAVASSSLVDA